MIINKRTEGDKLTIHIEGRLDTATSPKLAEELKGSLEGVKNLVFDFTLLEYISSSGLRVLIAAQKQMQKQNGTMVVKNPSELVMEVFEVTGFVDILTIE
ncbi:MAG: STAS domain-containing protein [Acutalibacteraceae bacterium]|nr:STAS domain-containing protein [Acutalibacteraceae bacterium]